MDIRKLRAYKLQLDTLGYIVDSGEIKGAEFYRGHLRSGKVDKPLLQSDNRCFQSDRFLKAFFYGNTKVKVWGNCTYKQVILDLVRTDLLPHSSKHTKIIRMMSSMLVRRGYISVIPLLTGDYLIKDNYNQVEFYHKRDYLYRVGKNNLIPINL